MATIVGVGSAKETLVGTSAGDVIIGGAGHNILYGKGGADVFALSERPTTTETSRDVIMDFAIGVDKVDVSAFGISSFEQLKLLVFDHTAPMVFYANYNGRSHSLEMKGIRLNDLAAADFIFSAPGAAVQSETKFNDVLFANNDGNTLNGGNGNDRLFGGNGNDTLIGGTASNSLYGNGGADIFRMIDRQASSAGTSSDSIQDFKSGVDKIDVSTFGISSLEQLKLLIGGNTSSSSTSFDAYYRGITHSLTIVGISFKNLLASDFIFSGTAVPVQSGTSYADVLFSKANGTLSGASGDDLILGSSGNDILNGGNGTDRLYGGNGKDTLSGNDGDDQLFGGDGNDILVGGYSYSTTGDELYGQGGADVFKMSARTTKDQHYIIADFEDGVDKIDVSAFGISGFEQLKLILEDPGSSEVDFGASRGGYWNIVRIFDVDLGTLDAKDFIFSKSGSITDKGTTQNDWIFGSAGNDTLGGSTGDDRIFGGAGNDVLMLGVGEKLYGGTGADIFRVRSDTPSEFYNDTEIMDFQIGVDKLDLSIAGVSSLDQVKLILGNFGGTTPYLFGLDYPLALHNVDVTKFTARDFVFDKTLSKKLVGTTGNDYLFGSAVIDTLKGGAGSDHLYGGAGNDTLSGGEGRDFFYGQAGADLFKLDQKTEGDDEIADFQVGIDRIDLSSSPVTSFEQLRHILEEDYQETGTDIKISSLNYYQSVHLTGVDPGKLTAADFIFSKQDLAVQTATVTDGQLFGGKGANTLIGRAGDDHIFGGAGNDVISGGEGDNISYGEAGADIFKFANRVADHSSGDLIADFQVGVDKLDISGFGITSFDQMKLILTAGTESVYFAAHYRHGYHFVELEHVALNTLTAGDFIFAKAPTFLSGDDDTDILFGGLSSDKISGGDGHDTLLGGAGNDVLSGGGGLNNLYGQGGADIFRAGGSSLYGYTEDSIKDFQLGSDRIDVSGLAVSSFDQLEFLLGDTKNGVKFYGGSPNYYNFRIDGVKAAELSAANFIFDKKTAVVKTGGSYGDVLFGSKEADKLSGAGGTDTLLGSDGNDKLYGDAGDDYLHGGNGVDQLTGGSGADSFFYTYLSESGASSATRDTIYDFLGKDGDRIDLFSIDANTKVAGDQAFFFLGIAAFTGKAGQLRYDKTASNTYIHADVDGDKKADFSIHLDDAVTLSKGYFVL